MQLQYRKQKSKERGVIDVDIVGACLLFLKGICELEGKERSCEPLAGGPTTMLRSTLSSEESQPDNEKKESHSFHSVLESRHFAMVQRCLDGSADG